ncbi:hypothetical protein KCU77_g23532, partial [Aureobasidium melanogenum]
MATQLPPPSKRQKTAAAARAREQVEPEQMPDGIQRIQFIDADSGESQGPVVTVPLSELSPKNLSLLLNTLLGREDPSERLPYRFYDPLGTGDFDQKAIISAFLSGDSTTEVQLNIP